MEKNILLRPEHTELQYVVFYEIRVFSIETCSCLVQESSKTSKYNWVFHRREFYIFYIYGDQLVIMGKGKGSNTEGGYERNLK